MNKNIETAETSCDWCKESIDSNTINIYVAGERIHTMQCCKKCVPIVKSVCRTAVARVANLPRQR